LRKSLKACESLPGELIEVNLEGLDLQGCLLFAFAHFFLKYPWMVETPLGCLLLNPRKNVWIQVISCEVLPRFPDAISSVSSRSNCTPLLPPYNPQTPQLSCGRPRPGGSAARMRDSSAFSSAPPPAVRTSAFSRSCVARAGATAGSAPAGPPYGRRKGPARLDVRNAAACNGGAGAAALQGRGGEQDAGHAMRGHTCEPGVTIHGLEVLLWRSRHGADAWAATACYLAD